MISAIVLAAGSSSRMGGPKPLALVDGRPMLDRTLEALRRSPIEETIVVLGAEAARVRERVDLGGTRVVENPDFRLGMSTSLRAGVASLSPESEAFLVVLGDAPFVRPTTYGALLAARSRTSARIVLPVYGGIRGNPVLIDRSLSGEVDRITGDRGCRALRLHHPEETVEVPVDDPGVVIDLDTPEELDAANELLRTGGSLAGLARTGTAETKADDRDRPPPQGRNRGREDLFLLASELERRREPFCFAIVTRVEAPTSGKPGFKAIVRSDGSVLGWVGGSCSRHALLAEARAALADGRPRLLRLRPGTEACPPARPGVVDRVMECQSGGAMDVYLEPHGTKPQLVVVGDSPLAEALVALGRLEGLRVIAAGLDLDPNRFPDADEVVSDLAELPSRIDRSTFAVVATMASYDARAVELLCRSEAPYVALVASRRRAGLLLEDLRAHGVPSERLERLRNPAGLDIGAETPEEIALSIVAEIVTVRRRTGGGASTAPAADPSTAPAHVAVDPVCRMEVEPESTPLRSVHAGTTYYFCSESCLRRFEERPAAFLG